MVVVDADHFGKQHAEESRHGSAAKKQRFDSDAREHLDPQELLAWELEQEKWTEKSDAAILEDPQWHRVGIKFKRGQSPQSEYSSSSDDERVSGRQSPMMRAGSPSPSEKSLPPPMSPSPSEKPLPPPMSPARSVPQMTPNTFLLEDQRKVSIASPRAVSPATIRSSSPTTVRPSASMMASMRRNYPNGQQYQTPNMRSLSPPLNVRPSSPMSDMYMYSEPSQKGAFGYTAPVQSGYQALPRAGSWNSYGAASRKDEADELEAEFQRLESSRGGSFGFHDAEERDERNAIASLSTKKEGYGLEELEQEFERLESRANREVVFVDESPSDEVIHLEDQASLEEDDPKEEPAGKKGFGSTDLEAEFHDAVRRKEALLRNCSMDSDSNETDDILGNATKEDPDEKMPQGTIPKRKTRLQERLDRFERGSIDAEPSSDVSKYPRLQQIRQRRRERLKALKTIRQERAEIWDTLEANWEHMEKSMTARPMTDEGSTKAKSTDPSPSATESEGASKPDPTHDGLILMEDDSLKLSASEPSSNEEQGGEELAGAGLIAEGPLFEQAKGKEESTSDLVGLLASMNEKNGITKTASANLVSEDIPASAVSLLENMTAGANGVEDSDAGEKTTKKEDPPTSFGAFLTQSMSDVGSKVVNILKAVGSGDEQQVVTYQGTDTCEEDANNLGVLTEEAREDDESSELEIDLRGFEEVEEEDLEPEVQGCVNPLQNFLGKQRRLIVVDDGAGQGCMNPFLQFGFDKAQQICRPRQHSPSIRKTQAELPGYIDPMVGNRGSFDPMQSNRDSFDPMQSNHGSIDPMPSTAYSDSNYYVGNTWSEDDQKFMSPPIGESDSQCDERESSKRSKRSKKSKKKKTKGGASDAFFTLVDDLLVNNILNIVNEKAVNDMAHQFGFD